MLAADEPGLSRKVLTIQALDPVAVHPWPGAWIMPGGKRSGNPCKPLTIRLLRFHGCASRRNWPMYCGAQASPGTERRWLVRLSPGSGGHRQRHESTLKLSTGRRWASAVVRRVGNTRPVRAGASVVESQTVNVPMAKRWRFSMTLCAVNARISSLPWPTPHTVRAHASRGSQRLPSLPVRASTSPPL